MFQDDRTPFDISHHIFGFLNPQEYLQAVRTSSNFSAAVQNHVADFFKLKPKEIYEQCIANEKFALFILNHAELSKKLGRNRILTWQHTDINPVYFSMSDNNGSYLMDLGQLFFSCRQLLIQQHNEGSTKLSQDQINNLIAIDQPPPMAYGYAFY